MEPLTPTHPGCTNPSRPHGQTKGGKQRWKCPDCGKTWTEGGRKSGRPKGDHPALTAAERSHRRYLKLKRKLAKKAGNQTADLDRRHGA